MSVQLIGTMEAIFPEHRASLYMGSFIECELFIKKLGLTIGIAPPNGNRVRMPLMAKDGQIVGKFIDLGKECHIIIKDELRTAADGEER